MVVAASGFSSAGNLQSSGEGPPKHRFGFRGTLLKTEDHAEIVLVRRRVVRPIILQGR